MEVLPDIVSESGPPRIVFCGMAGAASPKLREHYYATPGNSFWESLHLCGLAPRRLPPEEDARIAELGFALTDLVRQHDVPPTDDVAALVAKIEAWQPEWLAFTSKTVAHAAARHLGLRRPGLGHSGWEIAGAPVFVLPGTSGANQRKDYDGRPTRIAWWRDLAALAEVG